MPLIFLYIKEELRINYYLRIRVMPSLKTLNKLLGKFFSMRTGVIDSPLHPGRCPSWLFKRMVKLSGAISEVIIDEHGADELLKRLSNPFFFQALGCVIGFDWHSSGVTTTTCGALKIALKNNEHVRLCGGKGGASLKTPSELRSNFFSLSKDRVEELVYASRMTAKSDNSCLQDGYQLYHHCFLLSSNGAWTVIQQGMNNKYARRYHWRSSLTKGFVHDTNNLICCNRVENRVLDVTASDSTEVRELSVDLINDGPEHLVKYLRLPEHHEVRLTKRDKKVLKKAYEIQPRDYEELVSIRGFGPKKVRALALVCKLIYGAEAGWRDPVKYSFAHGGKDGHPYPVNKRVYDNTILTLREALDKAKLEKNDELKALKKLEELNTPEHF